MQLILRKLSNADKLKLYNETTFITSIDVNQVDFPIVMLLSYSNGKFQVDEESAGFVMPPKHLKFHLPEEINPWLEKAKQHMKELQEDLQMKVLGFKGFGKGTVKTFK